MKSTTKILLGIFTFSLVACGGPSLEKYYVENQEKDNFIVMNIPSNILSGAASDKLSEKEKTALQRVEKANILAFPLTGENKATFEKEKDALENILNDDHYKLLMKFGSAGNEVRLMYLGDPESIDEMIVYGASDERGFGVARILGNDMNPGDILNILKSLDEDQLDMEGLGDFKAMLHKKDRDSL